jgi:uncharacterized protein YceK
MSNGCDNSAATTFINRAITGQFAAVVVNMGAPVVVNGLGLTSSNTETSNPERDITSWTLEGCTTATITTPVTTLSGCTQIYSHTGNAQYAPRANSTRYADVNFANSTAYQYYRFIPTAVRTPATASDSWFS